MKKHAFSLRSILTFSFILLGGLPVLIMGFIAIKLISADIDMEVRAKNLLIAQSLSSEIQAFLNDSLYTLRLVENTIIKKQYINKNQINSYLENILMVHLEFDSVVILDEKGTVKFMAPYNQDVIGMNLSGQAFFSLVNRQYKQPYWSSTFISLQTGTPTLTLAIPVKGGAIVGYLNLATLNTITDRIQAGRLAYAMIIDREGTIIAHPDRSKVSERQNLRHLKFIDQEKPLLKGNITYREDSRDYLASLSLVPQTQWTVIITVPADEAFALVTRVRTLFAVGAAIVVLLAVGIVFLSLRKVLTPLSQLVRDARRIADGSYTFEEKPSSYKEIDELTDNFQRMAEAIQSREKALNESKEMLDVFFDAVHESMVLIDTEGTIILSNKVGAQRLGKDVREFIGTGLYDHFSPDIAGYRKEQYDTVVATGKPVYFQDTRAGKSFEQHCFPVFDEGRKVSGVAIFAHEITKRKRAEEALQESERKFRTIFEDSRDAIYITTTDGRFIDFNQAYLELFGYTKEEMLTLHAKDTYMDPADRDLFKKTMEKKGSIKDYEVKLRRKNGQQMDCIISATTRYADDGDISGYQGIIRDISERKRMEEKLHTMSLTDELTGLYNRRGFFNLAQQQMKIAERTKKDMLLFFADLDKMKQINDTLGHQEGDKALVEAAAVLKEVFRESDIIGRMGGDEFAILAIDTTDETREVLMNRLHDTLDDYNMPEGRSYHLALSIGIAHYKPETPSTLDKLMAQADALMYEEKRGRSKQN